MAIFTRKRVKTNDFGGILDPTTVRLSEHFLLSDMLGCNSVYTKGLKNVFFDPTGAKLAEGKHLCESLLEGILNQYGPLSVAYGYISPELSRDIVKYQDPDKPSYHRWDKGAAADICVHGWNERKAPIYLAHRIDIENEYSRMITYSESPYICVATQLGESPARKAFYENRYMGVPRVKPLYIRKPASREARRREADNLVLEHDWHGHGFPTYHGGGHRQLQHIRCGRYSMVSDFLYSTEAITSGFANAVNTREHKQVFGRAGAYYEELLDRLDVPRVSIVRAYESFRNKRPNRYSWDNGFAIDFKPPSYIHLDDLAQACLDIGGVGVGVYTPHGVVSVQENVDEQPVTR